MKIYKFLIRQDDDNITVGDYFVINAGTNIVIISEQEAIVNRLQSKPNTFKVKRTRQINNITAYICQCLITSNHDYDDFINY